MTLGSINRILIFCLMIVPPLAGCDQVSPDSLIARAEQALVEEDYRSALLDLKATLQKDPENPRARWLLAEVYLAVEDGASAQKELERARALGVGEDSVVPLLAHALWLQGEYDQILAQPVAENLSLVSSSELFAFRTLAQIEKGSLEEATSDMNFAKSGREDMPFVRFAKARLLVAQQNIDDALFELEGLTRAQPGFAAAWTLLGDLEEAKRRFPEAEAAYTQAISSRGDSLNDRYKRGLVRVAQGKLDEAGEDAVALQEASPSFQLGHYLAGLVSYRQKQLEAAQEALAESLRLAPRHLRTVLLLAAVDAQLGNENRSRRLAEQAVALQPGLIPARKLLATWKLRDGKGAEAEELVRPVVQTKPDDAEAKNLLAASLIAQAKHEEAASLLQSIAERQADSSLAQLRAGLGLMSAGNTEDGIRALDRAARMSPDDPAINLALIVGHLRHNDATDALTAARDYAQRKPDEPVALNLLAAAQLAVDKKEDAVATYRKVLELEPDNLKATQMLATIALADGNNDEVLSVTKAGLVRYPDDLQLLLLQAGVARQSADAELNRLSLQRAIDAHPNQPGPRALMARQLLDEGEVEKALTVLSGAPGENHSGWLLARAEVYHRLNRLNDAKRDLEALTHLMPDSVDLQFQLSRTYDALGDALGLERALNRMLELAPDDTRAILAKAQLAIVSGRPQEAREILESRGLNPDDDLATLTVWMGLARVEKDSAKEIAIAQRLTELQPSTRHTVLLSRAQQRAGERDEAASVLVGWLDSHPEDVPVLAELANLYVAMGRIDKSIEQLRRIESLDSKNVYALNNLAWYLRKSTPVEARRYAERAVEVAPDQSTIVDTYAAVLSEQREYSMALRVLQQAIDRGEDVAALRLRRVDVLRSKGDRDEAINELEGLLAGAPPPNLRERAEKELAELIEAAE